MNYLFLIPISIILGLTGLGAFFWALRHNQYEDLDGAAARVLNSPDRPISHPAVALIGPGTPAQANEILEVAQTLANETRRYKVPSSKAIHLHIGNGRAN